MGQQSEELRLEAAHHGGPGGGKRDEHVEAAVQVEQRGQPQRFQLECRCGRSEEARFGSTAKRKGGEPETE